MNFWFFCDESFDPPKTKAPKGSPPLEPTCNVVGGFISDYNSWEKIGRRWQRKNERVGVARFHAAHLNAATWEFDGWHKWRRLRYSRGILRILKQQGRRLHGMACGMWFDSYRKTMSPEGQIKLGHPYLVCFKTIVVAIAQHMEFGGYAPEDTFSVVLDRNKFQDDAIDGFYAIKHDPGFPWRHRLMDCEADSSDDSIGLQTADFVAYETFKLMQGKRRGNAEMRHAFRSMLPSTGFYACMFDEKTLERQREMVDAAQTLPNRCVIVPTYEWEPTSPGLPRSLRRRR